MLEGLFVEVIAEIQGEEGAAQVQLADILVWLVQDRRSIKIGERQVEGGSKIKIPDLIGTVFKTEVCQGSKLK